MCPNVDLVGVWGRHHGKASELANQLGCTAYDDVDSLLADVEAVAFALPPDVQASMAVRAAEAGCHLLLDKPLALTLDDADRVVESAVRAGITSRVFFTGRYQPETESGLQAIRAAEGWIGGRATVFVSVLRPGGQLLESTWRVERGARWDAAPHMISPLVEVLGEVEQVSAIEGAERTTVLVARHHDGATSTMATTLQAPPQAQIWEIQFYGESGWMSVPGWNLPGRSAFAAAASDLALAARDARSSSTERTQALLAARHATAVMAAAEESIATGRTVMVDQRLA